MIFGAHVIVYTKDSEADRTFFKDVLGLASVDVGHGWLIFAMPPTEVAFHPASENDFQELYFMCSDLETEMLALRQKGCRVFGGTTSRMGIRYEDSPPRRRQNRSLSTQARNCVEPPPKMISNPSMSLRAALIRRRNE
jgi:hypothetical protein